LDLGFIFIYIIPLLIGVMTCRLWANEKESGRLLLLKSVVHSEKSLINLRLFLIFNLIAIFQLLLLCYGFLSVGLSLNSQFISIYSALLLYQTLWFIIAWIINRSGFQSIKSTLIYITIWIFLTLVIPGTAINYSQYHYPTTQGINMMLDQRQHMHNAWDRDKQADLNAFYHRFPQYRDSPPLPEKFHWKWYFAMQLMSDRKVDSIKYEYRQQIQKRIDTYNTFSFLSPSIALQLYLTQQAKTDVQSQINYLQALETYHQSLFDYFAKHLFYDKQPDASLLNFPRFNSNYENRNETD
jgi:ABC-2 type transport system permease protein